MAHSPRPRALTLRVRLALLLDRFAKEAAMSYPSYVGWFQGHPACPCQIEWLPVFELEAQRRGIIDGPLPLSQIIGGAVTSGGTHTNGGADDTYPLTGIDVDAYVWLSRQMGADATWLRPYNWDSRGGVAHVHRVLTGCPHNAPAAYQIDAVRDGYNGLGSGGRSARDDGPRPLSGRTYKQGIAWAKEQQAKEWDEMATKDEIREVIADEIEKAFKARLGNGRTFISTVNLIAEKVGVKAKPEKP